MKTGLWKELSKNNNEYYKGKIEIQGKKYKVAVFINENKKTDKSPDMNIVLSEIEEKVDLPKNTKTTYDDTNIKISNEDLPF